jgi:ribosomal protein S18 acetylase RimI-like enzyme
MPILCRPARAQDLERADELVVASFNDLTQRHGFGAIATSHPPNFQLFSLKDDAGGLWVAEEAGEILGFAWSWVCGDFWFLAQLFVSPGHQGRGIGNTLLKRAFEHAEKSGATNRALITFTFNTVAQGLYIRNGLFPRFPIYNFRVAREDLIRGAFNLWGTVGIQRPYLLDLHFVDDPASATTPCPRGIGLG